MAIQKPYIMTRSQVKTYLQITDTSYDALIDAYLPVVSDDIALITNNSFIVSRTGTLTTASQTITDMTTSLLESGNVVSTSDFAQAEITAVDDTSIDTDTAASVDLADTDVYINVFPLAKKPLAARMVMYNIKKYTDTLDNGPLSAETVGSYSWKAANTGKGAAGYPQWIIDGLKEITRPRFY